MKENIKLGIILFIVAALSGLFLGGAYAATKDPIARQAAQANNNAMRQILPDADSFKKSSVNIQENGIVKEVNDAYRGTDVIGYAIKVTPKGYAGLIEIVVGISKEDKLKGIKILSHSETPGLGAKAPDPKFSGQFKNKPLKPALEVVKAKISKENQIDAITGATITSKAVTIGVNEAIEFYTSQLKGSAK